MAQYDTAVIGGGFYGARIALELARAGERVIIFERDGDLMQRASLANQARVHGGYHYPRSLLTALRSRVNLPVFASEYAQCIDDSFDQYYAISWSLSKVTAAQFRAFCERIEAPIEDAPEHITRLFDPDHVEAVFTVHEYAFDANKLRLLLKDQLDAAGVSYRLHTEVTKVARGDNGIAVTSMSPQGSGQVSARRVLNCTYSRINELNRQSGLPELALKHEIAEISLIEPPDELAGKGITVMCGPFFSVMPYPAKDAYSFTHVRYTPHTEWYEGRDSALGQDSYKYLSSLELQSAYPKMLADAARYLPSLSKARYLESLFEVKTILPQSEGDDSRPILFKADHGLSGYTCIMGGKLDNIYDVFKELREGE